MLTASPAAGLPFASVTVAVAVDVDTPSALIVCGENCTTTVRAGPWVWVSDAGGPKLGWAPPLADQPRQPTAVTNATKTARNKPLRGAGFRAPVRCGRPT